MLSTMDVLTKKRFWSKPTYIIPVYSNVSNFVLFDTLKIKNCVAGRWKTSRILTCSTSGAKTMSDKLRQSPSKSCLVLSITPSNSASCGKSFFSRTQLKSVFKSYKHCWFLRNLLMLLSSGELSLVSNSILITDLTLTSDWTALWFFFNDSFVKLGRIGYSSSLIASLFKRCIRTLSRFIVNSRILGRERKRNSKLPSMILHGLLFILWIETNEKIRSGNAWWL